MKDNGKTLSEVSLTKMTRIKWELHELQLDVVFFKYDTNLGDWLAET